MFQHCYILILQSLFLAILGMYVYHVSLELESCWKDTTVRARVDTQAYGIEYVEYDMLYV